MTGRRADGISRDTANDLAEIAVLGDPGAAAQRLFGQLLEIVDRQGRIIKRETAERRALQRQVAGLDAALAGALARIANLEGEIAALKAAQVTTRTPRGARSPIRRKPA